MTYVQPGWYADPLGRAELRWYLGSGWGEHVRSGGASGIDPLDPAGAPLWAAPRWDTPAAMRPAAQGPVGPAMGGGTKLALWLVLAAFVVLVVAGVWAVLVLARNVHPLTASDIERQVGSAMSKQYGTVITLDCPPVLYTGGADATVECTATDTSTGSTAHVDVIVHNAQVVRWQVLAADQPQA